jgi:hypothetical protein
MLQRQIVKFLGRQIEYSVSAKDPITRIHSLTWTFIFVNVTIYRTIAQPESYENSHYLMPTEPRSSI